MKLTILSKYAVASAETKDARGKWTRNFSNVFVDPDPDRDPDLHPELLEDGEGKDKSEQYKFELSDDGTEQVFNYKIPRGMVNLIRKSTSGPDIDSFNVYLVITKEK